MAKILKAKKTGAAFVSGDAPDIFVWVVKQTLTDGSEAFNVELEGTEIACASEDDAQAMAESIVDAINAYSSGTVAGVMY